MALLRWKPEPLRLTVLLVALVAALNGCQSDSTPPLGEVRDSAGVRLVSYDLAGVAVPIHRTVGARVLEIGARDGASEYTFSRIADLAISEDRQVVVSDAIAREIRIFSDDGIHQLTIGRAGDGPGEFAVAPTFADVTSDTVVAFDSRARRISYFLRTGQLLSETTLPAETIPFTSSVLRLDDGSFVAQSTWVNPATAEAVYDLTLRIDSVVATHLSSAGEVLDTLRLVGHRRLAESVTGTSTGFRTRRATVPYSPNAVVATDGFRLIAGRSDTFALEWIAGDGRREMVVRVSGVQHPATARDLRARQEATLREDFGEDEIPAWVRQAFVESLPSRLPAFGSVVVAEGGDLWVSLSEFDLSEGLNWLVFSAQGELLGLVDTPPNFSLGAVRDDFILGFVLDDVDVPYLHGHVLDGPPASEPFRP